MSAPKRFFVDKIGEEVLTGEEYRHAHTVLRLGVGDEVTLLDGGGKEFSAIVERSEKGSFLLHVVGEKPADREPTADVFLLIGALKGTRRSSSCRRRQSSGQAASACFPPATVRPT